MASLRRYHAAVLGAGPAGLAVVGTLLDAGVQSILWVDPAFNSGRLAIYGEVPSNTKVKTFTQYALVSPALAAVSSAALAPFKEMDPEKGCDLQHAKNMVKELAAAVRSAYQDRVRYQAVKVHCHVGSVSRLEQQPEGDWKVDDLAEAAEVFLCTGAHPRTAPAATPKGGATPRALSLDDMLTPSRIACLVSSADTVGVVGSSHSAVLVLRNLLESTSAPKVVNLYRSPLLYARYMDNWIMFDNTGLKGVAADWAREKLETGVFEREGQLQRICVAGDDEAASAALSQCTAVVQAIGFNPNPVPVIIPRDGKPLDRVVHDAKSGKIEGAEGVRGFGIAFPELVTDPTGRTESAVGLWKFMRYLRETLLPK